MRLCKINFRSLQRNFQVTVVKRPIALKGSESAHVYNILIIIIGRRQWVLPWQCMTPLHVRITSFFPHWMKGIKASFLGCICDSEFSLILSSIDPPLYRAPLNGGRAISWRPAAWHHAGPNQYQLREDIWRAAVCQRAAGYTKAKGVHHSESWPTWLFPPPHPCTHAHTLMQTHTHTHTHPYCTTCFCRTCRGFWRHDHSWQRTMDPSLFTSIHPFLFMMSASRLGSAEYLTSSFQSKLTP